MWGILSLILGCVSMILGCSGASAVLFGVIIGCVGTVMGFLGRRNQEFGVYAVVGLILSVIGVVVSVYFMRSVWHVSFSCSQFFA